MKDLFIYLLQSSICLSIFLGVYLLFLRKQTTFRMNRVFLLIGLIVSFILPAMQLSYTIIVPSTFIADSTEHLNLEGNTANTGVSIWNAISIIYILGVAVIMIRNINTLSKFKKLKKSGEVARIKGYIIVDNPQVPTAFSMFNKIFIDSNKLQQKEKEIIIEHEKQHIEQKHWIDLLCSECALLLQWFNPLMWFYIHLLKENHEYLADEAVLKSGESTAVYSAVLINQRFQGPVFSFSNSFNYSRHQNRLTMMKKTKTSPWKKIAVLAVLPFIGAFIALSAKPNYVFEEQVMTRETATSHNASNNGVPQDKPNLKLLPIGKQPLVIVDGVETPFAMLSEIDANTIESMEVFKDAAATKKYGEKGENGVIVIKTKQANNNK